MPAKSDRLAGAAAARPFVERRRRRSMEQEWHEALDSVHRLLVRYEGMNRQLTDAAENYRGILEDAVIGIVRVDPEGQPLFANRAMAHLCGYETPEHLLSANMRLGRQFFVREDQWQEIVDAAGADGGQVCVEAEVKCRNSAARWVQLNLRAVCDGKAIAHYEGTVEDITERRRSAERIRLLAYYDQITGLPNRRLFEEQLDETLARARPRQGRVALLLLEIGRFKIINDSLGKSFGDRLLQSIAERIKRAAGEDATVARIGGAEFAVILHQAEDEGAVSAAAQRIVAEATSEFTFLGHSLHVSCSVGVSLFPRDAGDGERLLQHADIAMDAAKERALNEVRFFSEEMNTQMRERLKLEKGLRLALERDELFLVYQPQVDTRTGAVCGLEALLRWQHPERGLVPPAEFIGVAESSGLIVPIGEWVLRTACSQAREWQAAGLPRVPVAVNVSAIQFRQHGFCDLVRRILDETGLDPQYLELELTEGLLLTNADVVFRFIQELRQMGVKMTIDDFGTGYSSLSYLRQFKVNRLKIDRSFVREVALNADDAAITTAIINMARALNLEVLAEGVENAEQLAFLRAQDCYGIQGYFFSRPVGVDQVPERLQGCFVQ